MDNVKVSIIMPVYNHEKYIKKAISSVLMQKVNFDYELLVGDDCSTDDSINIINEFKFYKQIKIIARPCNISNEKIVNGIDLLLRAKGEYVIMLEGDDYWTDETKLQRQVNFLDKNPKYIACAHKFDVVDDDENAYFDQDLECQFWKKNPYTKEVFEKGYMISHINTTLFRNINKDILVKNIFENIKVLGGDYLFNAYFVLNGKIHFIDRSMSVYRKVVNKKSFSYSSQMEKNNKRDLLFNDIIIAEKIFNERYKISFEKRKKAGFASAVFKWYREKNYSNLKVVKNDIVNSGNPVKYSVYFVYLVVARCILNLCNKKNVRVSF